MKIQQADERMYILRVEMTVRERNDLLDALWDWLALARDRKRTEPLTETVRNFHFALSEIQ